MKHRATDRHAQRIATANAGRPGHASHAARRPSPRTPPRQLVIALTACSLLTFWPGAAELRAQVLPSGMNTVAGQVTARTVGGTLTVNNSPNAIINWNSFSIGASNAVRFEQANAASQVLNRVVGNDPSAILGSLSSNGRVWLLNPNGVLFGQGARIDVAGLVTSTLNLNNADWLAGNHRFIQGPGNPTGIVNQGELRSSLGGHIALIGASVRNEGEINAPGGQVVLAAGSSVELIDSGAPNISVKLNSSAGEVVNLGRLMAAGGRIDVHAATVNQSGIVHADSLSAGPGGEIVLQATERLTLSADSQTSSIGGSNGSGGQIQLLGREVGLLDTARVDASGGSGGGEVLVGGGLQGKDPNVPNARAVYFAPDASILADATVSGDGGRIILWSDQATRAFGSLSARGGSLGGDGGFIETSGGWLDARPAMVDTSAPMGRSGTWLLDPYNITISDVVDDTGYDESFTADATGSSISSAAISDALANGNVAIYTGGANGGAEAGNITLNEANISVGVEGARSLTLNADGAISMTNSTIQSTIGPLDVNFNAALTGPGGISLDNSTVTTGTSGGVFGNIVSGGPVSGTTPTGASFSGAGGAVDEGVYIAGSTLNAGTANVTLSGVSSNAVGHGVLVLDASSITGANVSITGDAPQYRGVEVSGGSSIVATQSMSLLGSGGQLGVVLFGPFALALNPTEFDSTAQMLIQGRGIGIGDGVQARFSPSAATGISLGNGANLIIEGTAEPGYFGVNLFRDGGITATNDIDVSGGTDMFLRTFGTGDLRIASSRILGAPGVNAIDSNQVAISDAALTTAGSLSVNAGSLSLVSSDVTVGAGVAALRSLTLSSDSTIEMFSNSSIASGGGPLNVTFTAARSTDGGIHLDNSSVTSGSAGGGFGNIVFDGLVSGTTPGGTSFSGAGGAVQAGVQIASSTLNAGTADVMLSGVSSAADGHGVWIPGASSIIGANVSITGDAPNFRGIEIFGSSISATHAINLLGRGGQGGILMFGPFQLSLVPDSFDETAQMLIQGRSLGGVAGVYADFSQILPGSSVITARNGASLTVEGAASSVGARAVWLIGTDGVGPSIDASGAGSLTLRSFDAGEMWIAEGDIRGPSGGTTISADSIDFNNSILTTNPVNPGTLTLIAEGNISLSGSTIEVQDAFDTGNADVSLLAGRGGDGSISLLNSAISSSNSNITLGGFGTGDGVGGGSFGNAAYSNASSGVELVNSTLNAGTGSLGGGGGTISISGASGASAAGVLVSNNSVLGAQTIRFLGSSAQGSGVEFLASSLTTTRDISVEGVGAQSGILVFGDSSLVSSHGTEGGFLLSLAGSSTGNNVGVDVAGDLTANNGNSISVSASNSGGATPALRVTGDVIVSGSPGSLTLGIVNPAVDNSILVDGSTMSGTVGGILMFGASSLTLRDTTITGRGYQLQADNIAFEGATSLSSNSVSGDVIVLTNRNDGPLSSFINNSTAGAGGSLALQTSGPDARWIIWASDITTSASFAPGSLPHDFTLYGAAQPSAWASYSGNGYVSSQDGVATVVGTIDPKVYDATQTVVLQGPLQATGPRGEEGFFDSPPGVQFVDKNVGTAKPVELFGSYSVSFTDSLEKPVYGLTLQSGLQGDITPATLAISGLIADDKIYDATTAATLAGSAEVNALLDDTVIVSGTPTALFADKNVGSAKSVTVSGYTLSGIDALNYNVIQPSGLFADITPATLSVVGVTAANKVYDATTAATLIGTAGVNALGSDVLTLGGTVQADFSDKNVGTGKSVAVSGYTLGGTDAGNYILEQPSGLSADITRATLLYVATPVTQFIGLELPSLTGSVDGFAGGETLLTATTGDLSFTTPATSASAPGRYPIFGSGLAATNYVFVQDAANDTALTLTEPRLPAEEPTVIVTKRSSDGAPKRALNLMGRPPLPADPAMGGVVDLVPGITGSTPIDPATALATAVAIAPASGFSGPPKHALFAAMRVSSMTDVALQGVLDSRAQYKSLLFADAVAQLERDPTLADLPPCQSREKLAEGACILTEALKRELQAAPAPAVVQAAQAPSVPDLSVPVPTPAPAPAVAAAPAQAPAAPALTPVPAAQPPAGAAATPVAPLLAGPARRVRSASLPQIERKVALVIGVDRYADQSIPQLANAVGDARAIGRVLESQMGYETVVLENASKQSVVAALNRLALELGPKDSFVLYYAGHGELVESIKLGFWQLADSDAKRPQTWLSNADIGRMVAQFDASQVALISDSCYSGSLVTDQRIRAAVGTVDPAQLLARKSVVVMSSGGNEPVADAGKQGHSPFAWSLMNNMRQLSDWQPGGNVFERVRFAVARELPQRPQYGAFSAAGHQSGGDYLFEHRQLEQGLQ